MVHSKGEFRKWLTSAVAPLLRDAGFNRSGMVWTRKGVEVTEIIEVLCEFPRYSNMCSFTIELGLLHHRTSQILWGASEEKALKAVDATVHFRIGCLISKDFLKPVDKWWSFAKQTSAEISAEVCEVLRTDAMQTLEAHRSLEKICMLSEKMRMRLAPADQLSLAIGYAILGRQQESEMLFQKFIENPKSAWQKRAKDARDSLNSESIDEK